MVRVAAVTSARRRPERRQALVHPGSEHRHHASSSAEVACDACLTHLERRLGRRHPAEARPTGGESGRSWCDVACAWPDSRVECASALCPSPLGTREFSRNNAPTEGERPTRPRSARRPRWSGSLEARPPQGKWRLYEGPARRKGCHFRFSTVRSDGHSRDGSPALRLTRNAAKGVGPITLDVHAVGARCGPRSCSVARGGEGQAGG